MDKKNDHLKRKKRSGTPLERIEALAKTVEQRKSEVASADAEVQASLPDQLILESMTGPDKENQEGRGVQSRVGVDSQELVEKAQHRLIEMEQLCLFSSYPISSRDEFPTLLTRLPLFRPSRRSRQRYILDEENALNFEVPYGHGRKHGPPLTTSDEDTLIAIMRLRCKRLYGRGDKLPFRVPVTYGPDEKGCYGVHTVLCTVSQILGEKGLADAGKNYKDTLASVKRLAATTLEINVRAHERYFGAMERGTNFKIFDVVWTAFKDDGTLLIQFTPIAARWLEQEYTYIDWEVRKQLTDLGKALHRFLSSQGKYFRQELAKVAGTIGYDRGSVTRRRDIEQVLGDLIAVGWLQDYRITGTGRKIPHVLETWR